MLEDLRVNSQSLRLCCIVLAYHAVYSCLVQRKKNVLDNLWATPLLVSYRIITKCPFGYKAQTTATVGQCSIIHHGCAMMINKDMVVGGDFTIHHGVVIDNRGADSMAYPHIGNDVKFGTNVIILGGIALDSNATVGAGSVMLDSVPDNALMVGEKARVKVAK